MAGYDFKAVEQEIAAFWDANKAKIDAAIADANTSDQPRFSFLEGPPTANAPPALHHVEARVFKDLYTRYKTLQGYKVSRKGGWDCHGLPVEVQVEKKLGLKTKKDVLIYGVAPFVEQCKTDIFTYVEHWKEMTKRLAFWVDLEQPYMTLDTKYMESVWWALKEIHKKDLLYKGFKIVPYCGRCATPLSSHEVALGYKDVEDQTVIVHFPVKEQDTFKQFNPKKPVALLAWTTTPWTLPSNLALAVHPDVDYVLVADEEADYIFVIAKDLVDTYFKKPSIIGQVKGMDLAGLHYEPLFDYFTATATKSFRVITADYVTTQDGTGIVHQAPAFGEDDFNACKANGIDFVNPVDENAQFTQEVPDYQGQFVKAADPAIIEALEAKGRLFKVMAYVHSYPHCWRCATPLIYYAKDTWFIKVSDEGVKRRLLEHNEAINWHPSTIKHGRFGNWLEGARDWALSRNKFWGTPLPVWVSESDPNYYEVIGSIDELEAKTGVRVDDLHIGTVDTLTYTTDKGVMRRTPEVIDCWFDSGSAPFAQLHYPFENKELFEELFPYDYIAEGIDQTRGWFYTMHVINTILFDKPAYKNVVVAGLLTDDKGEKMSKSKGNILNPGETFDQFSVDGVRMAMSSYSLGSAVRFGPGVFKEQITPFFTTLWNSYIYTKNYCDRFGLTGLEVHDVSALEDAWMLSKLHSLVHEVTEHMENYTYNHALDAIISFTVEVLSRTYIKLIRDRTNESDKELAYVLRYSLATIVKLLAPFAPYITEKLYQDFTKEDGGAWSVHFSSWPKVGYRNADLEKEFAFAQHLIQGILAARDKAKIGVRWPLPQVQVVSTLKKLNQDILDLVLAQTNVKQLAFVDDFAVTYHFELDYRSLAQVFGEKTGDVATTVKKNMDLVASTLNQETSMVLDGFELTRDCFKMEKIVLEPFVLGTFTGGEAYLDTTQTDELLIEGYARELTRRFQVLRKDAGLEKTDIIQIYISGKPDVSSFHDDIMQKVGASGMLTAAPSDAQEYRIKDATFTIGIAR